MGELSCLEKAYITCATPTNLGFLLWVSFRRNRLLKSSSWPSTSFLDHLPLSVVPQRMLLKLREDNSEFLHARSSLCYRHLLITTISRFAIVRKSDILVYYLHVNEFIMPAVLQIYIKSTINRSILSKIIPLIMRFIPLIKRCLCIFLVISRVYSQSWIQSVGMTIHTYTRYTQLMVYTTRVPLTTASFCSIMYTLYTLFLTNKNWT